MLTAIDTEVLIIGGGGAGLRAAIEAAKKGCRVLIVDKGPIGRSGTTPMAMEALQAVCLKEDSLELHFQDTVEGGRYLGDENLVWTLVKGANERVFDLEEYGLRFKKKEDGSFDPMHHPGQTLPRTLFIQGGGYGLLTALLREARKFSNLHTWNDVLVWRLLPDKERIPGGAVFLDLRDGQVKTIKCPAIILATGGYEELWEFNDASLTACGDGVYLAYEIGAELIDLEMVQFYPTIVIYPPAVKGILFQYELVINPDLLGGRLLNGRGEPFFAGMPMRDVLLRAIWQEIQNGRGTEHGGVYIDLTATPLSREELTNALNKWQPNQFNYLKDMGVDLRDKRVEVAPHAHFTMGGVAIDEKARTSVPGLFAAGEAAGNLHGANRVSGNALTETQVFGAIAGAAAADFAHQRGNFALDDVVIERSQREIFWWGQALKDKKIRPRQMRNELKKIMWKYCGIERNEGGLKKGLEEIEELERGIAVPPPAKKNYQNFQLGAYPQELREALELKMMITISRLVLASALFRKETRGHHMRLDYPSAAAEIKHTLIKKGREPFVGEVKRRGKVNCQI